MDIDYLSFSWTFIRLQSGGNWGITITILLGHINFSISTTTAHQTRSVYNQTSILEKITNSEKTICSFHFGSYVFFFTVVLACYSKRYEKFNSKIRVFGNMYAKEMHLMLQYQYERS